MIVKREGTHRKNDPRKAARKHDGNTKDDETPRRDVPVVVEFTPRDDCSDVKEDGLHWLAINVPRQQAYRIQEHINDLLEAVFLAADAEPVVPGEGVANDEAAEDVVRADDADPADGEEGEGDTEREEGFTVDQTARVRTVAR